jgi:hypothetical protein
MSKTQNREMLENHENVEVWFSDSIQDYKAKYETADYMVQTRGETEVDALANLTDAVASNLHHL